MAQKIRKTQGTQSGSGYTELEKSVIFGDFLYFNCRSRRYAEDPWLIHRTNGGNIETILLSDPQQGWRYVLHASQTMLYAINTQTEHIFRSDDGLTFSHWATVPYPGFFTTHAYEIQDGHLLVSGSTSHADRQVPGQLWRCDASQCELLVEVLEARVTPYAAQPVANDRGEVAFAYAPGLWVTDGTVTGTRLISTLLERVGELTFFNGH